MFALLKNFPLHPHFLKMLSDPIQGPEVMNRLEKLVHCMPLTWIAFDPLTPEAWRDEMCRRLGWKMNPDLSCVAPELDKSLIKRPDQCAL